MGVETKLGSLGTDICGLGLQDQVVCAKKEGGGKGWGARDSNVCEVVKWEIFLQEVY